MKTLSNEELLQDMENGIIEPTEVQEMMVIMKTNKFNSMYKEAKEKRIVWKGEGKDQRWKFKTDCGSTVAKTSEKNIKKAYFQYLDDTFLTNQKETITFAILYSEWLDNEKRYVGIEPGKKNPSTFRRYQRDYERYIKDTDFDNKLIIHMTPIDIENFLQSMIVEHYLGKQCLKNVAGYIKKAMFYARKSRLISENPYDLVDLSLIKGFCKVIVKKDEERIINIFDMEKLISTLHKRYNSGRYYIQNYAIELAILTGMRVGELAALKWKCITETTLHIDYSEHRLDYENKTCEYYISLPKNKKTREFPMSEEIKTLFSRIKTLQEHHGIDSEYVFANKDGRVNSHTISCAMTRRCIDAGINEKSIHDIRRTVSSILRTKLPVATVANMLGHLEETNNRYYNYDVISTDQKVECLNEMYKTFKKTA